MSEKSRYTAPRLLTYGAFEQLTQHHRPDHDPQGKVGVGPDAFGQKSLDEELGS